MERGKVRRPREARVAAREPLLANLKVVITGHEHRQLKRLAHERGISVSALVRLKLRGHDDGWRTEPPPLPTSMSTS